MEYLKKTVAISDFFYYNTTCVRNHCFRGSVGRATHSYRVCRQFKSGKWLLNATEKKEADPFSIRVSLFSDVCNFTENGPASTHELGAESLQLLIGIVTLGAEIELDLRLGT